MERGKSFRIQCCFHKHERNRERTVCLATHQSLYSERGGLIRDVCSADEFKTRAQVPKQTFCFRSLGLSSILQNWDGELSSRKWKAYLLIGKDFPAITTVKSFHRLAKKLRGKRKDGIIFRIFLSFATKKNLFFSSLELKRVPRACSSYPAFSWLMSCPVGDSRPAHSLPCSSWIKILKVANEPANREYDLLSCLWA